MNMNEAHWHLLVNHLPILGGLFGMVILIWGIISKNGSIINLSLVFFIVCAVFSMIASQTGEKAERYLMNKHLIDETILERHAEAADVANYTMMGLGALALASISVAGIRKLKLMPYVILIVAIIAFVLMAKTASLGGEIMHKEIRSNQAETTVLPAQVK